ncbi:hypothetical protein F5876DRAFT_72473 [Lentinula aff. lateritia]|uniref:Uncharacterized protein n=1 Tax=Lentinula aff. lateritia TaxID=2804960 RepID=A0ACC1UE08_9AGAR|nr:hypothetical protein F5876DRAFT_72473 [Lentinula aff. lateritia]
MKTQAPQFYTSPGRTGNIKSWILRMVFVVALASTLQMSTVYASPLPTGTPMHANSLAPESTGAPDHARTTKAFDRSTMVMTGSTLIGFAYAKPEIAEERKGQFISVSKLILPNPLWSLVTDELYLLPKLGIVNQNPNNAHWNCAVYAKKSKIGEMKSDMVYKSREEQSPPYPEQPPPYPEQRPPSYTERPIPHVAPAQPANLQSPIVFFKQEAFPGTVAMRVPKIKIEEWGIEAMCYETTKDLLKSKASWNEWQSSIRDRPEDVKLM